MYKVIINDFDIISRCSQFVWMAKTDDLAEECFIENNRKRENTIQFFWKTFCETELQRSSDANVSIKLGKKKKQKN